jgi:hypothetical protein
MNKNIVKEGVLGVLKIQLKSWSAKYKKEIKRKDPL